MMCILEQTLEGFQKNQEAASVLLGAFADEGDSVLARGAVLVRAAHGATDRKSLACEVVAPEAGDWRQLPEGAGWYGASLYQVCVCVCAFVCVCVCEIGAAIAIGHDHCWPHVLLQLVSCGGWCLGSAGRCSLHPLLLQSLCHPRRRPSSWPTFRWREQRRLLSNYRTCFQSERRVTCPRLMNFLGPQPVQFH